MISISQRLRARQEPVGDGSGKWRKDGLSQEAANVVDALVAAVEAVELARHTDEREDWLRATLLSDAALAKAKGIQT